MAEQRFPKMKYLRQLRAMRQDLVAWEASYKSAAASTPAPYLAGRFAARAVVLQDVRQKADETLWALEQLPRVT